MSAEPATLEVHDLRTQFRTKDGVVRAVDGVTFSVERGQVFGLAGESGCGKTVTALSIMQLLPKPHAKIAGGEVRFRGSNLLAMSEKEMRAIRGDRIAMIFQDPMTSLNPVFHVGSQICEALLQHRKMTRREGRQEAIRLLTMVGIPSPKESYDSYPHQLSGGMRQRAMIAMALACHPDLLIADEPTTALDVTIQQQILALLQELRHKTGAAIILITHNLPLVAENCHQVGVMYCGQIVELAPTSELFSRPLHPYTQGLLGSLPTRHISQRRLAPIPGLPRVMLGSGEGCTFQPRCVEGMADCSGIRPILGEVTPGHFVRCFRYEEAK